MEEASVLVFRVKYLITPGLPIQERNAVIEAFIAEAIEGNDLQFGGGGRGDWQEGVAEPHTLDAATETQRQAVADWLSRQPWVLEFEVGPLGDGEETDPS